MSVCTVVDMVLVCGLFAVLGIRSRLAMGMGTVDNMRWDIAMCKCGYYLYACDTGYEQTDQNICSCSGGEAGAGEVLL